jgi:hypothetical protein
MSLLLDSLQRVKPKQRVFVAPPPSTAPTYWTETLPPPLGEVTTPPMTAQGIVVAPGVADAVMSDDLLACPVRQVVAAAAPGIVFSAADAGTEMSDDTLTRQVRQLASSILASYPGADALGLAFVTLHWPSEAPRFLREFARAFTKCAGADVLLVNNVRECGFEGPWQSWKQRFRYAIVQSEGGPNEVKLLTGADGVYLTVALGRTPRRRVNDSIALLRAAGAPIRGSVLIGQPQ